MLGVVPVKTLHPTCSCIRSCRFCCSGRPPSPATPTGCRSTAGERSSPLPSRPTKGGVGKTTIAYELAWLLDAPLVDLDWDAGGATRQWGYRHERRHRAPLLDALERSTTPVPLRGARKPDLVPSHPDFVDYQPAPEETAGALEKWAGEWGRDFVVVDTHPGAVPATFGAMAASAVVVVPVVLATKELEAFAGMISELPDYPILVVPNKVPRLPPAYELGRLRLLCEQARLRVSPVISDHRWLGRRRLRIALTAYDPEPVKVKLVAAEMRGVAEAVRAYE